jgi:hypothetical protein
MHDEFAPEAFDEFLMNSEPEEEEEEAASDEEAEDEEEVDVPAVDEEEL